MGEGKKEFLVFILEKSNYNIFKKIQFAICNLTFAILLASCANIVAPTGGAKDTAPPKMISSSPKKGAVNFTDKNFRVNFNEFIKLKDKEVLVSPPLKTAPKVKLRGKAILVSWKDTLKENTTYTFVFGDNIQDITEGNTLNNFQFVFSTGSVIDSLTYSGKVLDAATGNALENVSVMLYKENSDSMPSKQKPYYLAKTNKDGTFEFNYLKEGKYKIFALKDENYDLLYNLPNEKIAFSDSLISISKNTLPITLQLFENFQNKKQQLKAIKRLDGISYLFLFNKKIKSLPCTAEKGFNDFVQIAKNDSLQLFLTKKVNFDSLQLHIISDDLDTIFKIETKADSIIWRRTRLNVMANFQIKNSAVKPNESGRKQNSMLIASSNSSTKTISKFSDELNFNKPMFLIFNHPIAIENLKTNFVLIEDTGKFKTTIKPEINNGAAFQQKTKINYNFKEDHLYEIVGRKNQFTDVANISSDSFHISFVYKAQRHFGNILLAIKTDSTQQNLMVELLSSDGSTVSRERFSGKKIAWDFLPAGQYNIRLLVDKNGNGFWDTGNYFLHQQPESYLRYTNDVLVKPNWDTELEWKLK